MKAKQKDLDALNECIEAAKEMLEYLEGLRDRLEITDDL